ncbi:MAG: hypothetical protein ACYTGQ_09655 [Planctomycetota bacterium]
MNREIEGPARTSLRFNLISAALAFALWGGWAYYVNLSGDGIEEAGAGASAWVSALTQGTGSFLITLVMVRAVTWLYHRLAGAPLRLVWPAVLVVSVTGSCLATAHVLVGTVNIVKTISPALSVAFAFNVYTALKLKRTETGSGNQG